MNPLDAPAWASLSHTHRHLAVGEGKALRYAPDINRFAATADDSPDAMADLAGLIGQGDSVYLLQARPIMVPGGLRVAMARSCVQLVATDGLTHTGQDQRPDIDITVLGDDDAAHMLALAMLTRPGPFLRHTHRMGRFVGIRVAGTLVAMAGERFRFPGYTEVSGVCTHPDYRGRGFAAALSRHVATRILARGDIPFLQSWSSNTHAVRLYQRLGFRIRREIHVAALERS